jgi:sulfhydrogenase subunit beta (sulfur reductase)
MLYKIIKKEDFKSFIIKLIIKYDFIGPKRKDSAVHDFVKILKFEDLDLNYKRTTIAPAKKLLFPPIENLVKYEIDDVINITPIIESSEKILFGIDACDINGMNFLDKFFFNEYLDNNYLERRKKLIVIGVDREPSETSFALSMKAEYAKTGFDIFLTDLGDRYFTRIATAKGNQIFESYAKFQDATLEDFKKYNKFLDDYRSKFKLKVSIDNFYDDFVAIYDNNEFWNEISKKCFSCGSCNLVCPTCFCFNVRDDMELNLKTGIKRREWDSCMIPDYGLVAGGFNFRPTRANRLKQRYQCKLRTFMDKYETFACVGCGRCIEACLVNINIAEDINSVKREVSV